MDQGYASRWLSSRHLESYSRHVLYEVSCCRILVKHWTVVNDYREGKASYAMRWPNFYRKRARELADHPSETSPINCYPVSFLGARLRSAQKLFSLAERYASERTDAACQRALRFVAFRNSSMFTIERILQQGLEHDSTTDPVTGHQAPLDLKFLRPANHFGHTSEAAMSIQPELKTVLKRLKKLGPTERRPLAGFDVIIIGRL